MDKINPDRYKTGGIEAIDYTGARLTGERFKGYLAGKAIKYPSRFGHKDPQRARPYLNRLPVQRKRPVIYVCSPLRGDIDRNIHKAIGYSRYIYSRGGIPLAPHVIFTAFLDDNDPTERASGMEMGLELLARCDELWAFGDRVSEGMKAEIEASEKLGIRVKRFNSRLEVVSGDAEKE